MIRNRPKAIPALPGGILADEMGLGKTVEVLCCMLLHPRTDVELPEQLPVIEDLSMDSEENSMSPDSTDDATGGETQKKTCADVTGDQEACEMTINIEACDKVACEMTLNKEACDSTDMKNDLMSTSKEFMVPWLTHAQLKMEVKIKEFDVAGNISPTTTRDQCSNEEREIDAASVVSEKAFKHEEKLSSQEAYSIPFTSSIRSTHAQDDITFLVSKETIDLTGDSEVVNTQQPDALKTSNKCDVGHPESTPVHDTKPAQKRYRTSILNTSSEKSGNKVIIKINANKKATLLVERGVNGSTSDSESTNMSSVVYKSSSLNITSSSSSQITSSAEAGIPSPHIIPAHSPIDNSTEENALQRKKDKRKSKGYVEYVPITDEDTSYFTSKPVAQKQYFECNCGQLDSEEETRKKGLTTVKCNLCGMSQHAECMNYDLKDPFRGDYRCPHCHAVSVSIPHLIY